MAKGIRKRTPKAKAPKAEVLKCKHCQTELKKIVFDSRAKKAVYLYVCDKDGCPLYRQPQKYNGKLPTGINIAIV